MRVGTQQLADYYVSQIQAAQERYIDAQKRVTTGKKFENASENPGGAHFVINGKSLLARTEQYDNNLRAAKDYLANSESAFTEMTTLLNRANMLAINGSNSSYDQAARDSMANEIAEIQNRVVMLGNSTGGNGQFIFGGQVTGTKPFVPSPPLLTFNGDDNPVSVEIRPSETIRVNTAGAGTFFTTLYADLEKLKNDLQSGDVSSIGSSDIDAVQKQIKQVTAMRGVIGTKLQTVQGLTTMNQRRMDDLSQKISDVQEVDMAEAVVQLQSAQTAYTAALQVASRGQNLSLMDFLR
jgi:flagellar hook-associated protein 3 FlgL